MRFAFESCVLDLDTRQVFRDGKPADLSPKAFGLLELLVLQRPKAISKAEIHKALWPDTFVTETNLANLVVELRSALGDDAHVQKIVRTLPRFGYAFCADAHTEENNDVEETAAGDRRYCLVMGRREIVLLPGENLVGRDHSAAIWVNDESVSRRHARIAVDDAGAGYSGLQQVMKIQPDLIKLDRSLVANVDSDPAKAALIDSFVRFAARTGSAVCAEGIETPEELKVLADLDVTYGQGYFLAKPGPPWVAVSPWVSEKLLRRSLGGQMSAEDISNLPVGSDQRLAAVASRIAHAASIEDVRAIGPVIAEEMGADELVLFMRGYDGSLVALTPRPWLPSDGRLDMTHFPAFAGALRTGDPEQFLIDRGSGTTTSMGEVALLANSGFGSLLVVPVGQHAMLQAFMTDQRPWSRAQTNRALVLAYQLAPVLATLAAHAPAA